MAIAWMYREDYARAGYLVLPAKKRAQIPGVAHGTPVLCPADRYPFFAYPLRPAVVDRIASRSHT
jgi:hypothetical protein